MNIDSEIPAKRDCSRFRVFQTQPAKLAHTDHAPHHQAKTLKSNPKYHTATNPKKVFFQLFTPGLPQSKKIPVNH